MRRSYLIIIACICCQLNAIRLVAQATNELFSEPEVRRIISVLAADSLKGRGNGRKELLTAANFIANGFQQSGLQPAGPYTGFFMPFRPFGGPKNEPTDYLTVNGIKIKSNEFLFIGNEPGMYPEKSIENFEVIHVDSISTLTFKNIIEDKTRPTLIWSEQMPPDGFFPNGYPATTGFSKRILFLHSAVAPTSLLLSRNPFYEKNVQYNVIAVLPGESKPNEIILVSAHYDHEGVFKRGRKKDSIMNGANDDASGTTALLALADYYAKKKSNARTIMFCAFSGEELGLFGSDAFASNYQVDSIVANVNIEMIGIPQYGESSVFITGFYDSELPKQLKASFTAYGINTMDEPDSEKGLYYRSDNYSFAKRGVPSHTIMSSDDDDPCYHRPCDEVSRINIKNMTNIIKGIAAALLPLVDGSFTPERLLKGYKFPNRN